MVLLGQRGQRVGPSSKRPYPPQTFHRTGGQMWYIASSSWCRNLRRDGALWSPADVLKAALSSNGPRDSI